MMSTDNRLTRFISQVGVRQRREKDEMRVTQLTTELVRLEKLQQVEIKRRVELNNSIQLWAETQITQMTDTFRGMIAERSDAIQGRMEQVTAKIAHLEQKFAAEMAQIPVDIAAKTEALTELLAGFEAKFEAERLSRLEREGLIVKQLTDHEKLVAREADTERTARGTTHAELTRILDEHVRSRMKGDEKFQNLVAEELAELKNAVQAEQRIREREDDEIVDALNRYTSKLQASLRIMNSTET